MSVCIHGKRLLLRSLDEQDVTEEYCRWMNDAEVTRFTESTGEHTLDSIREFVTASLHNPTVHFMAIIENESGRHVGNIKLGPVHPRHLTGSIGIIIGEKGCWGQGYATEAIRMLTKHAFDDLGLYKVTAGCYEANIAAAKAFEKAGFTIEAMLPEQYAFEGGRTGKVLLATFSRNHRG